MDQTAATVRLAYEIRWHWRPMDAFLPESRLWPTVQRYLCVLLRCSRISSVLNVFGVAKTQRFGDDGHSEGVVGNEIKRLG